MTPFLSLSRVIDSISTFMGKSTMWLILATTLISAGNAIVRKAFDISSNGLLEIQWYLFAAVFMLGAGYGFLKNLSWTRLYHQTFSQTPHKQVKSVRAAVQELTEFKG